MTFEIWIVFVVAVIVFCIIPGPTVILVIGQAISNGKKSVLPLVAGVLLGDFTAMSLSLLGLGAVLATSSTLFFVLKWFGVGYLIYLGIKTWHTNPNLLSKLEQNESYQKGKMFKSAFLVTALNPKDIIFFVAFLPQFINQEANIVLQLLILMITFLSIVALNITFYTIFASSVCCKIQNYQSMKKLNKTGGGALIGAGLITATMQRT